MWDFDHGSPPAHDQSSRELPPELARDFEVRYTVPSACASALRENAADIGIIPAFAYTTIPGLVILPDVAIASSGAVRSILLVSKLPLSEVRSVALDSSSMTSVALTQVLFQKFWGGARDFRSMAPELDRMLERCDAALIIGDPALRVDRSRHLTFDLAEQWRQLTGKPFVFAFWAVRQEALSGMRSGLDLAAVFQRSRDHGVQPQSLEQAATAWSKRVGLPAGELRDYLARNVHYYLDADCLEGMRLFFRYAAECNLLSGPPQLRLLGETKSPATVGEPAF
jgi:chorismate dehydratase